MAHDTINKAEILFYSKETDPNGDATELKIYKLNDGRYPLGIKYSLAFVRNKKLIVGYDNHYPKGPHKHLLESESKYEFITIDQMIVDFLYDIANTLKK